MPCVDQFWMVFFFNSGKYIIYHKMLGRLNRILYRSSPNPSKCVKTAFSIFAPILLCFRVTITLYVHKFKFQHTQHTCWCKFWSHDDAGLLVSNENMKVEQQSTQWYYTPIRQVGFLKEINKKNYNLHISKRTLILWMMADRVDIWRSEWEYSCMGFDREFMQLWIGVSHISKFKLQRNLSVVFLGILLEWTYYSRSPILLPDFS